MHSKLTFTISVRLSVNRERLAAFFNVTCSLLMEKTLVCQINQISSLSIFNTVFMLFVLQASTVQECNILAMLNVKLDTCIIMEIVKT